MKKIIFLILILKIAIGCFAQSPYIKVFFNGINTECEKTISDTCMGYSYMRLQHDSIVVSSIFPKMYLHHVDSIKFILDTTSKKGTHSATYVRGNGLYSMSGYLSGVCIFCSKSQYDISIIFIGTTNVFDDSVKITRWEDNYAYTGGLWERCGLATNITSPYRNSKPNSQIVYSVYEAVGCCDEIPGCGNLIGRTHQFFDSKGRCNKEIMRDVSIVYRYGIGGKLKKELWYKNDSLLIAKVKYAYQGNKKKATYWVASTDDRFSVVTQKNNQVTIEKCYNGNGALLWARSTQYDTVYNESLTIINDDGRLVYKKKYEERSNTIIEGFIGSNHKTSYDYTIFDRQGNNVQIIQYELFCDIKIPVRIIKKTTIGNEASDSRPLGGIDGNDASTSLNGKRQSGNDK